MSKTTGTIAGVGLAFGAYYAFMSGSTAGSAKAFGSGPAFLLLKLQSSESVNHNTKRLRFELPTPQTTSGLPLTSALLTFSWPEGSRLPVLRPYTPVSSAEEPGVLDFLVKKYPDGKQSTHLHNLKPGDSLRFVVPIKGYKWEANKHPEITMIAGGAGITPMYQLARGILDNPEDKTKIRLLFGVNTDADVLLKEEFDAWEKQHPGRFKAVYTVSNPEAGSPLRKGYVDRALIEQEGVKPSVEGTQVFICGPPPMEAALTGRKGILEELGFKKSQIYKF